jgi:tetratricopeptide (TPR) repeat protein
LHLQFAYYESCLVVEYLVENYGLESLKQILHDLGNGLPINTALDRHTDGLAQLEQDFAQFARQRAESLAPDVDWTKPDLAALLNDDGDSLGQFLKQQPNNFIALSAKADSLIEAHEWNQAKEVLTRLIELYPEYTGGDNAYAPLAFVHRQLNETDDERRVLSNFAARSADALHAFLRLLELELASEDWQAARETAERVLAVNPLLKQPHAALAQAAEALDEPEYAIAAHRTLIQLGPDNPAETHFRLARLLHEANDPSAKRHVLLALEEAPRFRAAHLLLLEMHQRNTRD